VVGVFPSDFLGAEEVDVGGGEVLVEKTVVAEESLAGLVKGAADAEEDDHAAEDLWLGSEEVHVKVEELAAAFWADLHACKAGQIGAIEING